MHEDRDAHKRPDELEPATFHLLRGEVRFAMVMFVVFLAGGAVITYFAVGAGTSLGGGAGITVIVIGALASLVLPALAIVMMRRSRRLGEIVIDPDRGEIQISRSYEIPFSNVRKVEVVEHAYTYRGGSGEHLESFSVDTKGWAIDIGAGVRVFGQNGLSYERVTKIADALRARVEAYRARTHETAAPLPRPDSALLERLAGALREQGDVFEPNWLDLDGPMAEEMRRFNEEPDAQTMGHDGEFAKALRKAGYDIGEATPSPPTTR